MRRRFVPFRVAATEVSFLGRLAGDHRVLLSSVDRAFNRPRGIFPHIYEKVGLIPPTSSQHCPSIRVFFWSASEDSDMVANQDDTQELQ
jgi:hypothetical protein